MIEKIKSAIQKGQIWLLLLSLFAALINYLFQIYAGNSMAVKDFGQYNYLLSLIVNIYSLLAPLAVVLCRITAENNRSLKANKENYKKITIIMCVLLIIMIVGMLFSKSQGFWHYDNIVLFVFTTISVGICTVSLGVVQGLAKYIEYGLFNLILIVSRLVIFIYSPKDLHGALRSVLCSEIFVFILIILYVVHSYKHEDTDECVLYNNLSYKELMGIYAGILVAQLLYSLYINNGEILLMHINFAEDRIGEYSTVAMLCRVGLYITSVISTIMLPEIAAKHSKEDIWIIVKKSYYISGMIATMFTVGIVFFGKRLVISLYGEKYIKATNLIIWMIPFVFGITMFPIVNSLFIALKRVYLLQCIYLAGIIFALGVSLCCSVELELLLMIYGVIIFVISIVGLYIGSNIVKDSKAV